MGSARTSRDGVDKPSTRTDATSYRPEQNLLGRISDFRPERRSTPENQQSALDEYLSPEWLNVKRAKAALDKPLPHKESMSGGAYLREADNENRAVRKGREKAHAEAKSQFDKTPHG